MRIHFIFGSGILIHLPPGRSQYGPKINLNWHKNMTRSLLNLNMQVGIVSASLEQIQSFPDVPDFAYTSMGPHFNSKTHIYLTGGGCFFLHEKNYIDKRIWANLIKIPATLEIIVLIKVKVRANFKAFRCTRFFQKSY